MSEVTQAGEGCPRTAPRQQRCTDGSDVAGAREALRRAVGLSSLRKNLLAWRVLTGVVAMTAGWSKREDRVSQRQLTETIGLDPASSASRVGKQLHDLDRLGVITARAVKGRAGFTLVSLPESDEEVPTSGELLAVHARMTIREHLSALASHETKPSQVKVGLAVTLAVTGQCTVRRQMSLREFGELIGVTDSKTISQAVVQAHESQWLTYERGNGAGHRSWFGLPHHRLVLGSYQGSAQLEFPVGEQGAAAPRVFNPGNPGRVPRTPPSSAAFPHPSRRDDPTLVDKAGVGRQLPLVAASDGGGEVSPGEPSREDARPQLTLAASSELKGMLDQLMDLLQRRAGGEARVRIRLAEASIRREAAKVLAVRPSPSWVADNLLRRNADGVKDIGAVMAARWLPELLAVAEDEAARRARDRQQARGKVGGEVSEQAR